MKSLKRKICLSSQSQNLIAKLSLSVLVGWARVRPEIPLQMPCFACLKIAVICIET